MPDILKNWGYCSEQSSCVYGANFQIEEDKR